MIEMNVNNIYQMKCDMRCTMCINFEKCREIEERENELGFDDEDDE
jgi:hypothetical protein